MPKPIDSVVRALLQSGVERQIFSAASASIVSEKHSANLASGTDNIGPTTPATVFDIASLTKPFTASAALRLVDRGALSLSVPLASYLEDVDTDTIGRATVSHLLRHTAGLPAWHPFFEAIDPTSRGTAAARHRIIEAAKHLSTRSEPGKETCYSDVGFILLGVALEVVTGKSLSQIVRDEVIAPLALASVHFRPLEKETPSPDRIAAAPTERCPWRKRALVGEVHDDNAWTMGGVAGHAGLFATASDVAAFGRAWVAALDGRGWISRELARRATRPHASGRGLGWDFKSPTGSAAGHLMGDTAFGHLGFTGCSLWVDPIQRISIALLTNRVVFGRENQRIKQFRPHFHDAILSALSRTGT